MHDFAVISRFSAHSALAIVRPGPIQRGSGVRYHVRARKHLTLGLNGFETLPEKEDALQSFCHELRRPLAIIHAYADLLGDQVAGPMNGQQLDQVEAVLSASDRLSGLIDNLAGWMEFDAVGVGTQMQDVELGSLCLGLFDKFAARYRMAGITLMHSITTYSYSYRTQLPYLTRAIVPLLENGLQHTPRGGAVRMELERAEREYLIRVWNSAPSLEEEHLDAIFEPFFRLPHGLEKRAPNGLGLGLALARRSAERLGGALHAEAALAAGTTLILSLPHPRPMHDAG